MTCRASRDWMDRSADFVVRWRKAGLREESLVPFGRKIDRGDQVNQGWARGQPLLPVARERTNQFQANAAFRY